MGLGRDYLRAIVARVYHRARALSTTVAELEAERALHREQANAAADAYVKHALFVQHVIDVLGGPGAIPHDPERGVVESDILVELVRRARRADYT